MKVLTLLTAITSVAAFAPSAVQPRTATSALRISKEEDLELTRKVIQDFEKKLSGEPVEEEPMKEKKEAVAAAAAAAEEWIAKGGPGSKRQRMKQLVRDVKDKFKGFGRD